MKTWLLAVLGLIIFVVLGVLNQLILEKNTNRLVRELKKAETAIQDRKWNEAEKHLKPVEAQWRRIKPTWSILLHHREIDSIDQALTRTKRAIKAKDSSSAEVEQGSLENYVEHIPKREEFNILNIF